MDSPKRENYDIHATVSSAIGPWYVTYDPDPEYAGWGQAVRTNIKTKKEAEQWVAQEVERLSKEIA
jgi:hypothetical protein